MTEINPSNDITLQDVIGMVKSMIDFARKKIIFFATIFLIGAIAAFSYASFQKPTYTAKLTFALEEEKSGGGLSSAMGLASAFGIDVGGGAGGAFSGSNLIELMKSRRIIENALLAPAYLVDPRISLAEYYIANFELRKKWEKIDTGMSRAIFPLQIKRELFSRNQNKAIGSLVDQITGDDKKFNISQVDKKISIISIVFSSESEPFAKMFVESLAQEVSNFYIITKSKKARINVEILEHQTDSVRRQLNNAIAGIARINEETFNLNQAISFPRVSGTQRQVDIQANTAILTQLVANLELARVALRKETPLIQVIDSPVLPLPIKKIGKIKFSLLAGFTIVFIAFLFLYVKEWMNRNKLKESGKYKDLSI
ncbi:lipopolysaccharide biosynthesis protein [Sediminibacterium goheungense]|uniref:Subunit length determinant protein n=1 Tax=Sediminibacterium goheungense TaxID=1086393 RepID=A0A4R6IW33_9BACT|nr:lipopolysaccharide biosynthesis protein [Sediminibacterium goheungense]TDO26900.1 subunit length determinant protein [Sediminibacterium goheungense]